MPGRVVRRQVDDEAVPVDELPLGALGLVRAARVVRGDLEGVVPDGQALLRR